MGRCSMASTKRASAPQAGPGRGPKLGMSLSRWSIIDQGKRVMVLTGKMPDGLR
jgi:hypothetical protein